MRSGFCTVTKRNVKVLQEPYTDPYVRFCERADAAPDQRSVTLLDVCPACLPSRKVERNLRYLPVGKQPVGKGVAGNGGV